MADSAETLHESVMDAAVAKDWVSLKKAIKDADGPDVNHAYAVAAACLGEFLRLKMANTGEDCWRCAMPLPEDSVG